jgi:hypothetical protein
MCRNSLQVTWVVFQLLSDGQTLPLGTIDAVAKEGPQSES